MSSTNSEVFVIRKLTDSESVMRGAALLVISVPSALPDQAPLRARSPGSQETAEPRARAIRLGSGGRNRITFEAIVELTTHAPNDRNGVESGLTNSLPL